MKFAKCCVDPATKSKVQRDARFGNCICVFVSIGCACFWCFLMPHVLTSARRHATRRSNTRRSSLQSPIEPCKVVRSTHRGSLVHCARVGYPNLTIVFPFPRRLPFWSCCAHDNFLSETRNRYAFSMHTSVNFGSCSWRDLSLTISDQFTVLETMVQTLHLLLCK